MTDMGLSIGTKAVLEIEAPASCSECVLRYYKTNMVSKCFVTGSELLPVPMDHRAPNCPLKIQSERVWRAECIKCGRKWESWHASAYCSCGEKLGGVFENA